jgi:hypothetical protein
VAGDWGSASGYTVVLSSGLTREQSERFKQKARTAGIDAGILWSSDYPSLRAGFWVVYAGRFATTQQANGLQQQLKSRGYPTSYVRYVSRTGSSAATPATGQAVPKTTSIPMRWRGQWAVVGSKATCEDAVYLVHESGVAGFADEDTPPESILEVTSRTVFGTDSVRLSGVRKHVYTDAEMGRFLIRLVLDRSGARRMIIAEGEYPSETFFHCGR